MFDTTSVGSTIDTLSQIESQVMPTTYDTSMIRVIDTLTVSNAIPFYKSPGFWLSVVSVLIAVSAILAPRILEKIRENDRLRSLENYIYFLIDSIYKPIDDQITSLKKIANQVNDLEIREFGFQDTSELSAMAFEKISHNDLYEIFIIRKKKIGDNSIKQFKNLCETFEFIHKQKEYTQKNFFQYMSDLRRYEKQLTDNIDSILRFFDNIKSHSIRYKIPLHDRFSRKLAELLSEWNKGQREKFMETTRLVIFEKLKKLCVDHIEDEKANLILNHIIHAKQAYHEIINMNGIYNRLFLDEAAKLADRKERLQNAEEFFKGENDTSKES